MEIDFDNISLDELKLLVEQGNAEAQFNLGYMYFYGKGGIKTDRKESFKWWKLSANQGHMESQACIACMYHLGEYLGIEIDLIEAMNWYKKSADQGFGTAQKYLRDLLKVVRKSDDKQLLLEVLKIYDPNGYKLEIKSLEKQFER